MTDYRAALAELVEAIDPLAIASLGVVWQFRSPALASHIIRARAALREPTCECGQQEHAAGQCSPWCPGRCA